MLKLRVTAFCLFLIQLSVSSAYSQATGVVSTQSPKPTSTAFASPTASPSPSVSPSVNTSQSPAASATMKPSSTPTPTPSSTPKPTPSSTPILTPIPTITPDASPVSNATAAPTTQSNTNTNNNTAETINSTGTTTTQDNQNKPAEPKPLAIRKIQELPKSVRSVINPQISLLLRTMPGQYYQSNALSKETTTLSLLLSLALFTTGVMLLNIHRIVPIVTRLIKIDVRFI